MPNIQKMKRAKFGFRILSLFRVYDQSVAFFFFLLLPTQLAKHFFFDFSYLSGIRVDYLAIKLYVIDLVVLCSIIWHLPFLIHKLKNTKVVIIGGILLLNLLLSQSKIITWYQSIRIFEMILVVILVSLWVKNKWFGKTFLTASLMASMVQLGIAVIQLSKKGSIQGIFYFIGERFFTAATPGIGGILSSFVCYSPHLSDFFPLPLSENCRFGRFSTPYIYLIFKNCHLWISLYQSDILHSGK